MKTCLDFESLNDECFQWTRVWNMDIEIEPANLKQTSADSTVHVLFLSRFCPDFPENGTRCLSVRILLVPILSAVRILSWIFEKTLSVVCLSGWTRTKDAWLTIYFCLSSAFNILNLKYDRPLLDRNKRWSHPINVTQYKLYCLIQNW